MTNHQKRLSVPQSWPVERKEETFTVKAGAGPHGEDGVPLLILMRDVLGYVDSRKEARYALNEDNVVINGTPISDEERPVGMFDIVAFQEREEFYRVFPDEGGRLTLTPIDEDSAGSKLGKIIGKQQVPGGDVQLTLHDGQTLLVDAGADYAVDDSIVVDNEDDSIVAHFVYEEGALATTVAGRHAGRIGVIDQITVTPSSAQNNVILDSDGQSGPDAGFETIEEYIVVIDENFVDDDEANANDASAEDADDEEDEDEVADDDASAEDADDEEDEAEVADDDASAEDADDEEDEDEVADDDASAEDADDEDEDEVADDDASAEDADDEEDEDEVADDDASAEDADDAEAEDDATASDGETDESSAGDESNGDEEVEE